MTCVSIEAGDSAPSGEDTAFMTVYAGPGGTAPVLGPYFSAVPNPASGFGATLRSHAGALTIGSIGLHGGSTASPSRSPGTT